MAPPLKFNADDLLQAHVSWGCNCGPAALAACLGLTLNDVKGSLGRFRQLGYMNREMMFEAVVKLGFRCEANLMEGDQDGIDRYPEHGLCLVQFSGPWMHGAAASPKWAKLHTHWIACKKRPNEPAWIFDVNSAWLPIEKWQQETIPALLRTDKQRDGMYWLDISWEIRRPTRPACNRI